MMGVNVFQTESNLPPFDPDAVGSSYLHLLRAGRPARAGGLLGRLAARAGRGRGPAAGAGARAHRRLLQRGAHARHGTCPRTDAKSKGVYFHITRKTLKRPSN